METQPTTTQLTGSDELDIALRFVRRAKDLGVLAFELKLASGFELKASVQPDIDPTEQKKQDEADLYGAG
jgi:hypothetical protein